MKRFWWIGVFLSALWSSPPHTNALIREYSPYLQQHAHNPVDWYPWGKAAFEKAKREHKMIFLSIGYSTCHWCHEMEKESFSDREVAALLNRYFVSIKVDREEYPQLDRKYQALYRARYGKRGGWPLSVFMTPEGEVFYLTTYIPKEAGYGSSGLMKLLPEFAALLHAPHMLQKRTKRYRSVKTTKTDRHASAAITQKELMQTSLASLSKCYDMRYGGFGSHPKFPEASKIGLLLTLGSLTGKTQAVNMATQTMTKMARSGLYDQVEGGFFRYTTDAAWEYPHYEKMLYTNAELIALYARAYLLYGDPLYKRVVVESIGWVRRYFSAEGLFYAASDADSNGEEGGYYLYAYENIVEALGQKGWPRSVIERNLDYYGIKEDGNVDGELSLAHLTSTTVPPRSDAFKTYLATLRQKRRFPFVDHKILTSWNAMMVKALFIAGRIDSHYTSMAERSLQALLHRMYRNGRLYHQAIGTRQATRTALLEDFAYMTDALIEGYESTYQALYLQLAQDLAAEAQRHFYCNGVWYLSDDGVEAVADFDDRHYTAPLSVMLESLVKLAALTEDTTWLNAVDTMLEKNTALLRQRPEQAPKLTEVYLHRHEGALVIHARKQALEEGKPQIFHARYPFLLSKVQENAGYLACGIGACFASDTNITRLLEKIDRLEMHSIKPAWQKPPEVLKDR